MTIREALIQIINKNAWRYMEKDGIVKIDVDGKNGSWSSFARCLEEDKQFLFYSVCSSRVEEVKREIMALLLTRINYGLKIGNFEMDFDTGEVHFKTSLQFNGETIQPELIEAQIIINILTMDGYLPIIMKGIYSEIGKSELLDLVE